MRASSSARSRLVRCWRRASKLRAGMPIEKALKYCVLNRFSAEGGDVSERAKLLQIFQKIKN